MPEGSSSEAPVIRPGPRSRQTRPTRLFMVCLVAGPSPPARSPRCARLKKYPEIPLRRDARAREAGALRARAAESVDILQPGIDLPIRLILAVAVALLQAPGELGALALDHIKVIGGELSPLLLHFALELFPVAFNPIPIHRVTPPFANIAGD